jgi:hypothetical protein
MTIVELLAPTGPRKFSDPGITVEDGLALMGPRMPSPCKVAPGRTLAVIMPAKLSTIHVPPKTNPAGFEEPSNPLDFKIPAPYF